MAYVKKKKTLSLPHLSLQGLPLHLGQIPGGELRPALLSSYGDGR